MRPVRTRAIACAVATLLAAVCFSETAFLLLTNLNYSWSLESGSPLAWPATVLVALACGGLCVLLVSAIRRISTLVFVAASVIVLALAWILYPVACDAHESFLDRPNRVCECSGATLSYYPRGVYDGTEIEYCFGLERYA